jgi:hypothetical protein
MSVVGVFAQTYVCCKKQLGEQLGEQFEGLDYRSNIRIGVGTNFVLKWQLCKLYRPIPFTPHKAPFQAQGALQIR